MSQPEQLSADEIALYDRQIRLWGTDTQLRLRSAKILVIRLGAVGSETVKNLVLGGVNTIEILDDSVIREEDFAAQFFLPNDDAVIGQQKLPHVISSIKELNTRVHLSTNTSALESLPDEYFKTFDLIVGTELSKQQLLGVNAVSRKYNIPLYVAGLHGMFGYVLADLIKHESVKVSEKGNQSRAANTRINAVKTITDVQPDAKSDNELVTVVDTYVPLEQVFTSTKLPTQLNKRQLRRLSSALPLILSAFEFSRPGDPEDVLDMARLASVSAKTCDALGLPQSTITKEYLQMFSTNAFAEFAPSAAVLGGILAQDIIQYFGKKDSPINNCLIYDAVASELPIYYL